MRGRYILYYVGIVVMVVGLIGLIVCAKKQRVNPIMQKIAVVFALVMFTGLGLSLHDQMGGNVQSEIENEQLFLYSRSACAGKCLKAAKPGVKVLFVTNPGWEKDEIRKEQVEKQVEHFKATYGSGDVVVDCIPLPANFNEDTDSVEDLLTVKEFKALLAKHKDAGAVVTDIGLPEKGESLFRDKNAPVVFLLNQGNISGKGVKNLFKNGDVVGMINYKSKADYEIKADADDLLKSFEIRYELIDGNNYAKHSFD